MEIIDGLEQLKSAPVNPVVTVGNFDGLHLGHQALVGLTRERAKDLGGQAVAITFAPHPLTVLRPSNPPVLLTPKARKEELLAQMGLDVLVTVGFTREFASLSAESFFADLLLKRLGMRELVAGHSSSFGSDRRGGAEYLEPLGRRLGFPAHVIGPVQLEGRTISSSWIRKSVLAGDVALAARLMGRPHRVCGMVARGHDRGGRLLGFPTANLDGIEAGVPARGVYATRVILPDGQVRPAVTNIGVNPTFASGQGQPSSVETFILDFSGDLYGAGVCLDFVSRLREEKKFSGPAELKEQIARDVMAAKEILA